MSKTGAKGFPKILSSGTVNNEQPYIVLERLGLSIKDILKRNKKHFSLKCAITIGLQMVNLLEKLHDEGFIHCDLKPDNIMIGNYIKDPKSMNQLHLIDFGISQRYVDEDGKHHPMLQKVPFKGNVIFSSKNAFAQITLSRRDDIISLIYMLIFCINSKQAWIDNSRPVNEQFEEIGKFKVLTKSKDFCDKETEFLLPLLSYSYKLKYEEKPNYNRLRFMFKKILLDKGFFPSDKFDWSLCQGEKFR